MGFRRLLDPLAGYVRELDRRSRERMVDDAAQRDDTVACRRARHDALRADVAFFLAGLPAWLREPACFSDAASSASALGLGEQDAAADDAPAAPPGLVWLATVDLRLGEVPSGDACVVENELGTPGGGEREGGCRAGSAAAGIPGPAGGSWIVKGVARRSSRRVLRRGTTLRLLGRAASHWEVDDPWAEVLAPLDGAPSAERGIVFVVEEGSMLGHRLRLPAVAARPLGAALLGAAMVAPVGHRIADWPSAADEVLERHRERLAAAERATRTLAYEEGWGWRHLIGGPASTRVRIRPVPVERDEDAGKR